jgi:deoxyribodipyrimidine photo-lyase
MKNIAIVWFRNDLRLFDNEALTKALSNADEIVPVYVFDDRVFKGKTKYGFKKTGVYRAKFILESVQNLAENLCKLSSKLIIRSGLPEEIIPELANELKASWVFCNREMTDEEIKVQDKLEYNLWKYGREMVYNRGKMLYYTADLPFPIMHTPDVFTNFRKEVEKTVPVRKPLETPSILKYPHYLNIESEEIPSLEDWGHQDIKPRSKFVGGEDAALAQLKYYLWDTNLIKNYKETRNELLGWEFSSKFSPWLASGSISPKTIYHEVKKFEKANASNESTYWLIFELLWRDFFRLMGKKFGNQIFKESGFAEKPQKYSYDNTLFTQWADGKTGIPFVDANMRELNTTGFMSNRGRQNVASFLCKDLGISWLMGAEYFESMLIDYDPCSNYGNWTYIAGVGNDPREDRTFNVIGQGKKYDSDARFIKHWCPEFKDLPPHMIHEIGLTPSLS